MYLLYPYLWDQEPAQFYLLSKESDLYHRCRPLDYHQESPDHPESIQH
nr:MAG TPA: hypothetical protein [Caudoviricetes sp.]